MNGLLAQIKKSLPLGQFGWNVATLAGGTALGQAIAVLASPLLTRLYSPSDLGMLEVYTSLLSLALTVASLRYEMAIPLPEEESTGANLLALSLAIVAVMSLFIGGVVWLLGDQIVAWTNTAALRPYLWLLPMGVLAAGIYQALNYWALRKKEFGRIAQTKLNQAVGMVGIQLAAGLFKAGPLGLLLGDVFGRFGGSTTLAALAWKQDRAALKDVNPHAIRQAGQRYRKFPLISSGSGLLNSAGVHMPSLLFAAFYGPQVAGWFALGLRVMAAPMTLIGDSVAQVYYSEASRLAQDNPAGLYRLFWTTAKRLLLMGGIPIVILGVAGSWLFSLVFGAPWARAGLYAQILALEYLARFIVVPLAKTPTVLERQDLQLAWDAGRLVLVAGSLAVAKVMALADWAAVAAYGAAMLLAYGVLFFLSSKVLQKRLRESPPAAGA